MVHQRRQLSIAAARWPDGSENPRMQIFVRPYPQRIAGTPNAFCFDFATRELTAQWTPDASISAPTLIYVPAKRHYAGRFRMTLKRLAAINRGSPRSAPDSPLRSSLPRDSNIAAPPRRPGPYSARWCRRTRIRDLPDGLR